MKFEFILLTAAFVIWLMVLVAKSRTVYYKKKQKELLGKLNKQ